MGVKYDAVKDDKIKVTTFSGSSLAEVTEQMNKFLDHKIEFDNEIIVADKGFRYVPLGIAHSTEVKTYTDKFGISDHHVTYHLVLTYKTVLNSD